MSLRFIHLGTSLYTTGRSCGQTGSKTGRLRPRGSQAKTGSVFPKRDGRPLDALPCPTLEIADCGGTNHAPAGLGRWSTLLLGAHAPPHPLPLLLFSTNSLGLTARASYVPTMGRYASTLHGGIPLGLPPLYQRRACATRCHSLPWRLLPWPMGECAPGARTAEETGFLRHQPPG